MEVGRIIFAGIAFSTAAAGAVGQMRAGPILMRPGPCAAHNTYLLAANSGAIIQIRPDTTGAQNRSIVFRQREQAAGWASQRLLQRFDLEIAPQASPDAVEGGVKIINSGQFCREGNQQ